MDEADLETRLSDSIAADTPEALERWGPFEQLQRVGRGSFGEVYRAFDPTLQRYVALKLLLPSRLTRDEEINAMFREARAMARVRHPNIVPIYGVDRYDGRVGFWSDFVKGQTLADLVMTQGAMGPREAALVGIEVCRAAGAVHAAGFLHRDIKPGNIMREDGKEVHFLKIAGRLKVRAYFNLCGKQAGKLDRFKEWLAYHGPILTRLRVDPSWNNIKPDGQLRRYDKKRANGGHAVSIVGYTPTHFIIRNRWGVEWGHKGFAYASYEYVTDAFHEAYGIVI